MLKFFQAMEKATLETLHKVFPSRAGINVNEFRCVMNLLIRLDAKDEKVAFAWH